MDVGMENESREERFVFQRNTFLVATAKPKHKSCFAPEHGKCYHLTFISNETRGI